MFSSVQMDVVWKSWISTRANAGCLPGRMSQILPGSADALEEIAFHWVAVSAQDLPPKTRGLHELRAIWENSTKHAQTESIYNEWEARAAVEMAAAIAGGKEALRKRPVLSIMQCTAPPLGQDGGSVDAALIGAEAGLPVGFMTMAACLTTGPATMAGNLVVGNAEVISATALIELAFPEHQSFMLLLKRPLIYVRVLIPVEVRKIFSLELHKISYRISIISPYPWDHLPPVPRNQTGMQVLKIACLPLWQAWSCRICCWVLVYYTAAGSGLIHKC